MKTIATLLACGQGQHPKEIFKIPTSNHDALERIPYRSPQNDAKMGTRRRGSQRWISESRNQMQSVFSSNNVVTPNEVPAGRGVWAKLVRFRQPAIHGINMGLITSANE